MSFKSSEDKLSSYMFDAGVLVLFQRYKLNWNSFVHGIHIAFETSSGIQFVFWRKIIYRLAREKPTCIPSKETRFSIHFNPVGGEIVQKCQARLLCNPMLCILYYGLLTITLVSLQLEKSFFFFSYVVRV